VPQVRNDEGETDMVEKTLARDQGSRTLPALSTNMAVWWWLSAPYSVAFIAALYGAARIGIPLGALGHSGIIVPFLALAVFTSLSSAIWLLAMVRRLVSDRASRLNLKCSLMLSLSAIASVWVSLYLAKG
jgi:hypothetical protein